MKKPKPETLATDKTAEGILKRISEYYYGTKCFLNCIAEGRWVIYNSKGQIPNVSVITWRDGYKFQREP